MWDIPENWNHMEVFNKTQSREQGLKAETSVDNEASVKWLETKETELDPSDSRCSETFSFSEFPSLSFAILSWKKTRKTFMLRNSPSSYYSNRILHRFLRALRISLHI